MTPRQFQIATPPGLLADLELRLDLTRWNDAVADGWSYGTDRTFLKALIDHWRTAYSWPHRVAALNELPQFRTEIDGFGIHFLHYRGKGPSPIPLLLMNGWPSSFIEYRKLAPVLSDPAAFGGNAAHAFDVIIPALPGYGFSDRPVRPLQVSIDDLFFRLMTESLGYPRFGVAGTDIGSGTAVRLGHKYPEAVTGIHVTTIPDPQVDSDSRDLSPAERDYLDQRKRWVDEEGAYSAQQRTRPQTLAFGLADSPVGLASWIIEKFYNWSDCGGDLASLFPLDDLIDNLMIYWMTGTIGSSVRHYYEYRLRGSELRRGDRVTPPAAVLTLPKELARPPREWAGRLLNVVRYSSLSRGGHFPGWEVPDLYAADLQAFFASLRA